jgi:hypothetical protein
MTITPEIKALHERREVFRAAWEAVAAAGPLAGWRLELEGFAGCWCWTRPDSGWCVYATPFWDDMTGVPVAVLDERGGLRNSHHFAFEATGDAAADVARYREGLEPLLPE